MAVILRCQTVAAAGVQDSSLKHPAKKQVDDDFTLLKNKFHVLYHLIFHHMILYLALRMAI